MTDWEKIADVLAEELARHGWGDFHYASQDQAHSVLMALSVYREAKRKKHNDTTRDV